MPSAEDDYIERAKSLWLEYQFYVYIGLAMIIATILGFTLSHASHSEERDAANYTLYQLVKAADDGNLPDAQAAHEQLLASGEDYAEIAHLGAFALASLHYSREEYSEAAAALEATAEGSNDSGMRQLAALRAGEALIAGGEFEAAVELLEEKKPASGHLLIMFDERIGDAHYANNNVVEAQRAYERAAERATGRTGFYAPILSVKLGALLSNVEDAQSARLQIEAEEDAEASDSGDDSGGGEVTEESTETAEAGESTETGEVTESDESTESTESSESNETETTAQ